MKDPPRLPYSNEFGKNNALFSFDMGANFPNENQLENAR